MKKYYIAIAIIVLFFDLSNCKKDTNNPISIIKRPESIYLRSLNIGQNKISFNWSSIDKHFFREYSILKFYNNNNYGYELIGNSYNWNDTSFIDTVIQNIPTIRYQITAKLDSGYILTSNIQIYNRPNLFYYSGDPFVINYFEDINRVYFVDNNKKTILSANFRTLEMIGKIQDSVECSYICSADNGSGPELYVPKSNGILSIYNALTLEKKFDFNFNSFNKNYSYDKKIYSSTTDGKGHIILSVAGFYNVIIIDRKNLSVSQSFYSFPYNSGMRLIYTPLYNRIFGIDLSSYPSDISVFNLGSNYLVTNMIHWPYHGEYFVDGQINFISPKEDYFINSNYGNIYNFNSSGMISFYKQLFSADDYTSNADGSLIYSCSSQNKNIIVNNYPNLTKVNEIKTMGNPIKIFKISDTLYCFSRIYGRYSDIMMEKVFIGN